jgi:hypothetical protein
MGNTISTVDASIEGWRNEAAAAAESYVQEQEDAAARARDEAERQARDGVEPPAGRRDADADRILGTGPGQPPANGTRPGTSPANAGGRTGPSGPNSQPGTPEPLTPAEVAYERSHGSTVIDAGNGTYYVTRPYDHQQFTEKATLPPLPPKPPEPPGSINWLPGSNSKMPSPTRDAGAENPPGGAPPDPPKTGNAAEETKPASDPTPIKTGLGEKVDQALNEILNKSPQLRENLEKLLKDGWRVQWGKSGVGLPDYKNKIIYLDPSLKGDLDASGTLTAKQADNIASVLVHEVGHATHPPAKIPMDGLTEEEYVRRQVDAYLDSEGAAAFENARALHQAGPNGASIAGLQDERYQQIYNDYLTGKISEQEAIRQMGQVFGGEIHGDRKALYRDVFIEAAQRDWADAHPQN